MKRRPVVAIVGRPNVGKSTLFNRLTRTRRALVHDLPGVTRDRIVGEASFPGGDAVILIDTGGLLMEDEDHFIPLIRSQVEEAIKSSDAVVFVTDGCAGPIPEDFELARRLRFLGVPVVLVVNKADHRDVELQAQEFHALGLGTPVLVSAEHGTGIAELWEALEPFLPDMTADEDDGEDEDAGEQEHEIRIALIGRPNVGKSSLLNRLVGQPRVLVSEIPGTTRDAVDVLLQRDGKRFRFVDTAGIRRRGKTDRGPEVLSVVMARQAIKRAHICCVLVDAADGIARQDAHIAGYAWEAGRAIALIVNKWDLAKDRATWRDRLLDQVSQQLKFIRHAPIVFVSALTGSGVKRIFPVVLDLHRGYRLQVTTSEINDVLKEAWQGNPPPGGGGREAKLFYATQIKTAPPSFVLFTNLTGPVHFSYERYLENTLRNRFELAGVPIRVIIRGRGSRG
ncbi:MAG: ribosome biogenesis GTPase Der [Acidobacteria bacterium]|nr:ribosome biogenesis GTPase Der [Acidobacteriota bacterium]